jgi:L-arabinose isomerase
MGSLFEVEKLDRDLPKVGLLPFYLELYDKTRPERRSRIDAFCAEIASALAGRGLNVTAAPVCRVRPEFEVAVQRFESANVDAIVTLHLAYSPSLESAAALAATQIPIVVLDTTPTYSFGAGQDPLEIFYNHGIHGVQDMCNLLLRNKKAFVVAAGHWQKSDVLDRVVSFARSARLAGSLRRSRVGRFGPAFPGMGDFAVPAAKLQESIGVQTIEGEPATFRALVAEVRDEAVEAEMASDHKQFLADGLNEEVHRRSTRAGLAVRLWLEREKLNAFTVNFMAVDKASGLPAVPFLEASKAMGRGIGYAGEGDILTAALVGALASAYPETSFTEMFCPDWEGDQVFLSHLGEMNIKLTSGPPKLIEKQFPFTDVGNPVVAAGCFRSGFGVLVNLAPSVCDTFSLIIAPITIQQPTDADKMADSIHGWFKAALPVGDFLAEYSRAGGTHHSAMVYGKVAEEIAGFGKLMSWKTVLLQ